MNALKSITQAIAGGAGIVFAMWVLGQCTTSDYSKPPRDRMFSACLQMGGFLEDIPAQYGKGTICRIKEN